MTHRISRILTTCLFLIISCSASASETLEEITFSKSQQQTVVSILEKLRDRHYRDQTFDDDMSKQFLIKYLDRLDPGKGYFLQLDITEFSSLSTQFDDQLWNGDLNDVQRIYHRFRVRATERLQKSIKQLESSTHTFSFNSNLSIVTDLDTLDYVKSSVELDLRWQKRITHALLNLKLSDKSLKEAKETLIKRYSAQLKIIHQQDPEDAFASFTNALTGLYDPHTNYLSPRTLDNFNISMSLSLEGIGAVLQKEDEFTKVVRLIAAGPADKQGSLKPSERIIGVGQGIKGPVVDVVGWRLDDVVDLIRGPKDSIVRLKVIPSKSSLSRLIAIERDKVKLEEQAAQKKILTLEDDSSDIYKIGVINLPAFYLDFEAYRKRDPNYKSTTRDVIALIKELNDAAVDGIIIDLRYNGGGSLQEATQLTDLFINQGPVVQIRHSNNTVSRRNRSRYPALYRGPMVVLVNRLSASASEIFAGAIQDYGRGLIVGSQSFGKGTVQALTPLKEGQLKLTESKFYRVSGESTQHRGVIPDILLPDFYDPEEIGESTYKTALPWDVIEQAPHANYLSFDKLLPLLKNNHQQRVNSSAGFTYIAEKILLSQEVNSSEAISLNELTRMKRKNKFDNKLLLIENSYRKQQGKSEVTSLEKLDEINSAEDDASAAGARKETETDIILLEETGNILVDFIKQSGGKKDAKLVSIKQ